MTTQTQSHVVSLSTELAQLDDVRRQSAQRWQAALHRVCLLRATKNETTYEVEWVRIFDHQTLMDDMQRSKLLAFAAISALEVQHEHALMVCQADGIAYDSRAAEEIPELLAAMRTKIEKGLP